MDNNEEKNDCHMEKTLNDITKLMIKFKDVGKTGIEIANEFGIIDKLQNNQTKEDVKMKQNTENEINYDVKIELINKEIEEIKKKKLENFEGLMYHINEKINKLNESMNNKINDQLDKNDVRLNQMVSEIENKIVCILCPDIKDLMRYLLLLIFVNKILLPVLCIIYDSFIDIFLLPTFNWLLTLLKNIFYTIF